MAPMSPLVPPAGPAGPAGGPVAGPRHDPAALLARYRRALDRRQPWEAHWQDCVDYTLPQRDGGLGPAEAGGRKAERVYDATAGDAAEQLAASLLAQLTPPWSRWIGLAHGPALGEPERAQLAPGLSRVEEVLQGHFDRSNFAVEMHQCFLDLVVLGTACLLFEEAPLGAPSAFRFTAVPLREAVLEEGPDGQLDVTFRRSAPTAGRLIQRFGGDRLPEEVHAAAAGAVDEATQLCRRAAAFAGALHLPSVALEVNGLGRFLPGLLRRELAAAGVPAAVREVTSRRPKDLRILEAFDAPLAAGALYAHDSVFATPFLREMRDWRPGQTRARDDGLDAVAGCLASEPVRLPRLPSAGRTRWRPGAGGVAAPADFEV